jgi:hypothetical protein
MKQCLRPLIQLTQNDESITLKVIKPFPEKKITMTGTIT